MMQIDSLIEYFIGMKQKFKYDEGVSYYYQLKINRCKELLRHGIEYTTFEQFEAIK